MVGILSGDQIGFIDPHERFFKIPIPNTEDMLQATSSFKFKLDGEDMTTKRDQFQPFRQTLFGMGQQRHFEGTVFRFPLRQSEKHSAISKTVYTEEKILKLFDMFKNEAHQFLLFLSKIEKIEIYVKENNRQEPKLIHSIKIAGDMEIIRNKRKSFRCAIENAMKEGTWLPTPYHVTFPMKTVQLQNDITSEKRWLITHYYEGGESPYLKRIMERGESKMLPRAGICMPLDERSLEEPQGQIFCFLPLPAERPSATGFHFHVHGYFAVDQNRWDYVIL